MQANSPANTNIIVKYCIFDFGLHFELSLGQWKIDFGWFNNVESYHSRTPAATIFACSIHFSGIKIIAMAAHNARSIDAKKDMHEASWIFQTRMWMCKQIKQIIHNVYTVDSNTNIMFFVSIGFTACAFPHHFLDKYSQIQVSISYFLSLFFFSDEFFQHSTNCSIFWTDFFVHVIHTLFVHWIPRTA